MAGRREGRSPDGDGVAKNARLEIERKTGLKVISPLNAADAGALDVDEGPSALPEKQQLYA